MSVPSGLRRFATLLIYSFINQIRGLTFVVKSARLLITSPTILKTSVFSVTSVANI